MDLKELIKGILLGCGIAAIIFSFATNIILLIGFIEVGKISNIWVFLFMYGNFISYISTAIFTYEKHFKKKDVKKKD